jgi:hypothetical protein
MERVKMGKFSRRLIDRVRNGEPIGTRLMLALLERQEQAREEMRAAGKEVSRALRLGVDPEEREDFWKFQQQGGVTRQDYWAWLRSGFKPRTNIRLGSNKGKPRLRRGDQSPKLTAYSRPDIGAEITAAGGGIAP